MCRKSEQFFWIVFGQYQTFGRGGCHDHLLLLLAQRIYGDQLDREPSALAAIGLQGTDLGTITIVIENDPTTGERTSLGLIDDPCGKRMTDAVEITFSTAPR